MKLKLIIFLLPCIMLFCKSKETSTLIYHEKNEVFEISLSTIDTKINESGVAQCSNYAKTSIRDSVFHSYGLNLIALIAITCGTIPKYVLGLPVDSLKNQYLDLTIKSTNGSRLNYRSILESTLTKVCHFKVNRIDTLINGYLLIEKDSEKLKNQQTACKTEKLELKNEKLIISKCHLKQIANELDHYADEYIKSLVSSENCYSFNISIGDSISEINESLIPFGLYLKKARFQKTFFEIQKVSSDEKKNKGAF